MAISQDEHNPAPEPKGATTPTATAAGRQAPKTTALWVKDDESISPEEFVDVRYRTIDSGVCSATRPRSSV